MVREEVRNEDMDLVRPLKRQRAGSTSEEDIPLAELSKRLKLRNARQKEIESIKKSNVLMTIGNILTTLVMGK